MKIPALLTVLVAGIACAAPAPDAPDARPLLAAYVAYPEDAPGLEPGSFGSRQMFFDPEPIFSDRRIVAVQASTRGSQIVLDVRLDEAGAERLRTATGENIGRVMLVMFDSEIATAPSIQDEIGGGRLQIPIQPGSEEEGDRILSRIEERWPSGGGL